jgi:uncharacterized RDD family membrane protein YckC
MGLYQEDRELVPRSSANWRGYVFAGWWRRVGASLIDALVVGAVGFVFAVVFGIDPFSSDELSLRTLTGLCVALAYFPAIMRATDGQTLGKMTTRIRVVRTDGHPMSLGRATWREVVLKTLAVSLIPPYLWVVGLLDDLWPLWDRENRAIHDMLAGTRVVRSDLLGCPT